MNSSQVLSLREAASQLGCSKETVRRAVVAGELEAMPGWGQRGRELRVSAEGLLAWWQRHTGGEAVVPLPEAVGAVESVADEAIEAPPVSLEADAAMGREAHGASEAVEAVPLESHAADEALKDEAVEVDAPVESFLHGAGEAVGAVPLAVHSHALEVALRAMERAQQLEQRWSEERELRERAERQAVALASELGQYRRALSESAESLAEERSRAQAAELLCATLKGAEAEAVQRGWGARLRSWLFGAKPG